MAKSKGQTPQKPKRYVTGGEIEAIYQDLFERSPDKNGLDYWIEQLKGKTAAEAYDIIGKSATGNDAKEVSAKEIQEKAIQAAYREQLGREADATGLKDYIAKLEQGSSINDINQSLNRSLEGQNYDTQLLTSGYRQMFERNPEQEGFQYWFSRMQTDPALAERALKDYLEGGAQNTDIAKAAQAVAEGYYTNIISPDLEADPYGGRGLTQSIYDVPADAANLSYIDGQAVQFAAPVTQGTVRSTYTTGTPEAPGYTATAGENILQSGAVAAAAARALNSGAMSADEFRTLQTDLRAAGNDVNKIFTALNTPKAHVVLDELYGFQLGAGNTLAEAQTRAQEIQGVLDSLGTSYAPSNFMVADRAKELNIPYAFGKDAYTGYNTQATQADIINQANAEVKAREAINALEGALTRTQRPQYGQVQFAQQPAGLGALKPFQTFADRPLLGGSAPGAVAVPGMAAPTPYVGVPATPARPAINLSPQYQGAQDVAGLIKAAQNYVAPRAFVIPPAGPALPNPFGTTPTTPGTTVPTGLNPITGSDGGNDAGNSPGGDDDDSSADAAAAAAASDDGNGGTPVRRGGYIRMADGGIASLARRVQDEGRGNDTMLVHMTPNEVAGLQALAMQMGGSGTINPYTGLPEFGWLDKAFKKIIKPVAKVAQFILPFTGIGLPLASVLSGIAGGFAGGSGKTFDFKRALASGITSYGIGSLARNLTAANQLSSAADTALATGEAVPVPQGSGFVEPGADASIMDYVKATGQNIKSAAEGIPKFAQSSDALKAEALKAGAPSLLGTGPISPVTAGTMAVMGASTTAAMDKEEQMKREKEEEEERMRNLAYGIMGQYPIQFVEGGPVTDEPGYDMAAGGLKEGSFVVPADVVAHLGNGSTDAGLKMLAKKYGATPIKGNGDGMSDSIPTTIAGKQPARVADGEAVIPPEVVRKVGPKKLYAMMDQVRKARTGTTKQGREINPMRYMPA